MHNIFICLTYPQLVIADYFAEKIHKSKGEGSLLLCKYFDKNGIKDSEYIKYKQIKNNIFGKIITGLLRYVPSFVKIRVKHFDLFYFNDRDPITMALSSVCKRKILIEEGIGTYMDEKGITVIGDTIVPDFAYVGFPELYTKTHKHNDIELKNLEYSSIYSSGHIQKFYSFAEKNYTADIVFLGQASKNSQNLRMNEINILIKIKNAFPMKKIVVKPHPSDTNPEGYMTYEGIEIINDVFALPIEALSNIIKCSTYVSLFSSACVSIARINPNYKVIYGINLEAVGFDNTREQLLLFSNYIKNVHLPNSYRELLEVIKTD